MALPSPASDALLQAASSPPPLPAGMLGEDGPPSLGGTSGVGSLTDGLPAFFYDPPIEAVVFAFGVNEDLQVSKMRALLVSCPLLGPASLQGASLHGLACAMGALGRLAAIVACAGRTGAAAWRGCCQQHPGRCRRTHVACTGLPFLPLPQLCIACVHIQVPLPPTLITANCQCPGALNLLPPKTP